MQAFVHHIEAQGTGQRERSEQSLIDIVDRMRPLKNTEEITIVMRDIRQCISSIIIYAKDKNTNERYSRVESPP